MQNIAEFRIIGRIGKVEVKEKVTYVSVASNYNRKDGDDWKSDAHWNSVTLFDKLAKRLTAGKGDLVRITGRVLQNNYEAGGTTRYDVDLIADGIAILAKKDGGPADIVARLPPHQKHQQARGQPVDGLPINRLAFADPLSSRRSNKAKRGGEAAPLVAQSCFSSSAGPPSFFARIAIPSAIRSTS